MKLCLIFASWIIGIEAQNSSETSVNSAQGYDTVLSSRGNKHSSITDLFTLLLLNC
jgi:hypothetical protein